MLVGPAPAFDEIADIARLARGVLGPPAVEDPRLRPKADPHGHEGPFLGDPHIGIGGVGEEEPVKMIAQPRRGHVFMDRLHGAEDPRGRLVVDGHDHGGAMPERPGLDRTGAAMEQQPEEAENPTGEGDGDPGKVADEQNQQRPFERGDGADVDDAVHFRRAIDRQRQPAAKHEEARQPGPAPQVRRQQLAPLAGVKAAQGLGRHGQQRLGRHAMVHIDGRG